MPTYNDFAVGVDEIIGEAINELTGVGAEESPEQTLAMMLQGDAIGIDDILGAVARKAASRGASGTLQKLAQLKAAGQRGVQRNQDPSGLKWELLPIPLQTLAAGTTVTVNVSPTRSQRLDQIEFPSSNVDHQFIALISVTILGVEQLNGAGGVLLSQLSELRTNNILRGSTAQRSDNIQMIFQNLDTVNARTCRGTIGGPTLREVG